ncbi:MAG: hypothetical protein C5B51_18690 [Terriglobia bacterium]|nr:MAG: hypothetical protein C5B51_18690 [Terriglobia bacterium]
MKTKELLEATCPECRGPLSEVRETTEMPGLRQYKCLVGHVYSARTLLQGHSEAQEKALWSAVVALEESAVLAEKVASQLPREVARRVRMQASVKVSQAAEIRKILERLEPFQTD